MFSESQCNGDDATMVLRSADGERQLHARIRAMAVGSALWAVPELPGNSASNDCTAQRAVRSGAAVVVLATLPYNACHLMRLLLVSRLPLQPACEDRQPTSVTNQAMQL